MRVIYPGPHEQVTVPAAGVVAPKGEPVDIPDRLATSLLEQGWQQADDPGPDPDTDATDKE